jgi:predicted PurR-regulated permease PerM
MTLNPTPARILGLAIVGLSFWIVHPFIDALLAACVTAIASWPLYTWFLSRLGRRVGRRTGALMFTCALTVFVLTPMVFAGRALLGEIHLLLLDLAAADSTGMAVPAWLADAPVVGPWLAARWQGQVAQPGALLTLTQHTDPTALLGWMQSLGQFTVRQAFTIGFAVLLLSFLFQDGATLARELTGGLRKVIGDQADRYVDVATRAVRASVGSMVIVSLFDTVATGIAYALAGAPRALVWAAITGALGAVPFLGYVAVAAMAVQLALKGMASPAVLSLISGSAVLLCGDKLVRPLVARSGVELPFVLVLMGSIGGFAVLGLAGLVIGPVVLSLARELWQRELVPVATAQCPSSPAAD